MSEEPSAKALAYAQKHRDAFNAFLRVGYTREEAIMILNHEGWYHYIFEEEDAF